MWTDELVAELSRLWNEGHSTAEIGRRLGVTKNAVVGKANRIGLPARQSPIKRTVSGVQPDALRRGQCAWPIGDPRKPGFRFCGKPSEAGKPYCMAHCQAAYIPDRRNKAA